VEFPLYALQEQIVPTITGLLFLANPDIFRHWRTAVDRRTNPFTFGSTTQQITAPGESGTTSVPSTSMIEQ